MTWIWWTIAAGGFALMIWATATLLVNGVKDMRPLPPKTRLSVGPYRWLRHPMYHGTTWMLTGLTGAASGWLMALVIFTLTELVQREWAMREDA